jgi:O-antigen ligase
MILFFYLLVLSLPFVDHGFFGREIAGLTLEKIIGAVCFLYALAYLPRRRALPALFASAEAKAFAVYVVLALTSYVVTAEEVTFHDFMGIFLSQFLFFITVMILVDSRERLQHTILVLIASIGLTSLYLIREWIGSVPMYGLGYRPGAVAGDPNLFSASALVVLPLMLYPIAHAGRGWQRVGIVACLGVTLFAFLLAASRGGFIGLVCMFLWQLRTSRRRFMAIAVCTMVLLVCMASPYSPLDRFLKPTAGDIESSNIRLQLWAASGKIIADHPVFGVGLWNFRKYLHGYLPHGVDLDFVVPHNTYLEVAVDLGGVGLLTFVAILALSLWDLRRMRRAAIAAKDAYYSTITGSLSSGLIGFGVAVLFLSALHAKVFWFGIFLTTCIGPLLAQSVGAAKEEKESAEAGRIVNAPATEEPVGVEHIPIQVGNWLTRH